MYAHWFTYGRLLCEFCCVSDDSAVRWTLVLVSCAITYLRIAHYPASGYAQLSRCIHLWVVWLSLWTFSTHGLIDPGWPLWMLLTTRSGWLFHSWDTCAITINCSTLPTHTSPALPTPLNRILCYATAPQGCRCISCIVVADNERPPCLGMELACTSIANCTAWSGDLRKRTTTWHPNLWPTL